MAIRAAFTTTFSIAFLFVATSVAAQTTQPASKPTSKPTVSGPAVPGTAGSGTAAPKAVDSEVTGVVETAESRMKRLEAQLAKIRTEADQLNKIESTGGVINLVRNRLGNRSLGEFRTVQSKPKPLLGTAVGNGFRLMSGEERAAIKPSTVFLAGGHPVDDQDFRELLAFVMTYTDNVALAHHRTVMSLATHAMARAEIDDVGMEAVIKRVTDARALSAEGQPFYRVAELYSDCRTANRVENGELGWLSRSDENPMLMRSIFEMKAGERSSKPIRSELGLHYVEVMDRMEGATDKEDSIRVKHTLAMFTPKSPVIAKKVRAGSVSLVFRDAGLMKQVREGANVGRVRMAPGKPASPPLKK